MLTVLRVGLLVLMFFVALSLAMAVGSPATGPLEKVALAGGLLAVLAVARPVHRLR